ncbi:MAG: pilus assembly protein PilM [Chromatiales bacterium]
MALLRQSNVPLLGIDISSTSVKLIELGRRGRGYHVESYAVEPLPPSAMTDRNVADVELVGQAIQRATKKSGTRTRHAACAVAGSAVITKIITMPAHLSDEEMENQIQIEADQYIPYRLEEVRMDFEVLRPSENEAGKVEVLLAASRQDNVDVRVAALEHAGLITKVVDVEAFALENSVGLVTRDLPGGGDEAIVAVADVGATLTTLSVLQDMKIIYSREQQFGGRQLTEEIQRRYGLSYEEAGLAKRQGGLPENYEPEVLEPFKSSMAMEISRALQFFYSASQIGAVDRIYVAGGCAAIPGMPEAIESKTGTQSTIANPFAAMSVSPRIRKEMLHNDAPALMIACGLALRSFD